MTKVTALAIAAIAIALPAQASAKGIENAKVCGASGCTTIKEEDRILPLIEGGGPRSTPPAPAPSYTVEFTTIGGPDGERHSWKVLYVPGEGGKLRSTDESNLRPGSSCRPRRHRRTRGWRPASTRSRQGRAACRPAGPRRPPRMPRRCGGSC